LAELANRFLEKGRWVHVRGRIRNYEWLDRDQKAHRRMEIAADELTFLRPMDAGLNICVLSGNLGRDPDTCFTTGSVLKTSFPIAVNSVRNGGEEETTWVNITCFGDLARAAGDLQKGARVAVFGRFHTYTTEDLDGTRHRRAEVIAEKLAAEREAAGENKEAWDEQAWNEQEWDEQGEELPF